MISNIIADSGYAARNQFQITTPKAYFFQSYNSVVCRIDRNTKKITLSQHWDYSDTTRRYLYIFLRNHGYSDLLNRNRKNKANTIRKAIANNEIILRKTNSLAIK